MALHLSKTNIVTSDAVEAAHITQSIDAFTGVEAYSILLSGSLGGDHSISISGSISGSSLQVGGNVIGKNFSDDTPGVGVNQIKLGTSNRIDLSPNNTVAIRLSDSLVTLNKSTLVNGEINVSGNITSSGYISGKRNFKSIDNSEGGVIAMSGSANGYDSGTIIGLDLSTSSTNLEFKLPSLPPQYIGYEYDFVVNNTAGSGVIFKISAVITEGLNGIAICDDGTEDIQGTTFTFAATKAIKGTRLKCIADGVGWHMTAFCLCDLADVSTG